MASINPYLNFLGNTEDAFILYKSVFGGEFAILQRFSEVQGGDDNLSEADKNKIMHIALPIGDGNVLMGTDVLESAGHSLTIGNNVSLSINTKSKEEAERIFNGLSADGKIEMPIQDTFWGAYFGMFEDKFGIKWMVNYDYDRA
jgi:PhnB protein